MTQFVIINAIAFVLIHIAGLICKISGSDFSIISAIQLQPTFYTAGVQPWGLITYMFSHDNILHILCNMLWLYWIGIICLECYSRRQFVILYIGGGLLGGLLYLVGSTLVHFPSAGLLGSSAAVLSIVTATAFRVPDYQLNLFIIGRVKIKWLCAICLALMLLTVGDSNLGGQFAHLGGLLFGLIFFCAIKYEWFKKRNKCVIINLPQNRDNNTEAELDKLLIKIKQSGYNSLTGKEKRRLTELSKEL